MRSNHPPQFVEEVAACYDREHYNSCNFSKHNWDDIESQVKEIMEMNKIREYILWFGRQAMITDEMTDLELKIATYNRTMGNRFYVPQGIKEYLKKIGTEEKWREIYTSIMRTLIYGVYNLHKERTKAHARITNAKKYSWELINDNYIKEEEEYVLPKRMRYNTVIDLRGDRPTLIHDQSIKRERTTNNDIIDLTGAPQLEKKKRKMVLKKTRTNKRIIITGKVPTKKVKNKT